MSNVSSVNKTDLLRCHVLFALPDAQSGINRLGVVRVKHSTRSSKALKMLASSCSINWGNLALAMSMWCIVVVYI